MAIRNAGTPKKSAIVTADSIKSQAPATTPMIPKIINRTFFCVFPLAYFFELSRSFLAQQKK